MLPLIGEHDNTESSPTFIIRWFTPQTEVGLCGHATLAAAHSIFENLASLAREVYPSWTALSKIPEEIRFASSTSGMLSVRCVGGLYELDFPLRHPRDISLPLELTRRVLDVFGLLNASKAEEVVEGWAVHDGSRKYLLVLKDATLLEQVTLGNAQLLVSAMQDESLPLEPLSVTITAKIETSASATSSLSAEAEGRCSRWMSGGFDVVSRHFAPWVGIPEDPVTGAAHVVLAPYWVVKRTGALAPGSSLSCYQASRRGGSMTCIVKSHDRIGLQGNAVTFSSGHIFV